MKKEVVILQTKTKLMANELDFTEEGKPVLPSTLNVLTILTFTWCAISALLIIATPAINKFFMGLMDKALTSGQEMSAKQLADIEKGKTALALSQANMVPLIAVGLIGVVLCFVGALWMRKLKKDGFWLYTAGELLPVITGFVLMGTAQLSGIFAIIIGLALPILFIVLYATQRKYLTH